MHHLVVVINLAVLNAMLLDKGFVRNAGAFYDCFAVHHAHRF